MRNLTTIAAALFAATTTFAVPAAAFDLDLDLGTTLQSTSVSQITGELASLKGLGVSGVSVGTIGGVSLVDFGVGVNLDTYSFTNFGAFNLGKLDGFAEFGAGSEGFGELTLDVDFDN